MILYPSLHIKDGVVARLTRSSSNAQQAELLHPDPVARAVAFEHDGFSWLHILDLDGAFSDAPVNDACIEAIIKAVKIPVQLSGGIRDMAAIENWLSKGWRNGWRKVCWNTCAGTIGCQCCSSPAEQ